MRTMLTAVPTSSERRALYAAVARNFERAPKLVELFKLLFENSMRTDGGAPLTDSNLTHLCPDNADPKNGARQLVTRLRKELKSFFTGDGRTLPWRVEIGSAYRLVFARTAHSIVDRKLVAAFWKPILGSPVRLLYGEPQFFQDRQHTYFRNPRVTMRGGAKFFDYLHVKGQMKPNTSFVPAGVVGAMFRLVDCFQELGVRIKSAPVRPGMTMSDYDRDEHLIALGPLSTNRIIATLEASLPMRSTDKGIVVQHVRKAYKDSQPEVPAGSKWAVLTRYEQRYQGKYITVVSAEHGRTVQAVAEFLTRDADLRLLLNAFGSAKSFPLAFQVLFEVRMSTTESEPWIGAVFPRRAINLEERVP